MPTLTYSALAHIITIFITFTIIFANIISITYNITFAFVITNTTRIDIFFTIIFPSITITILWISTFILS